jgi:hypothetical protein
MNALEGRIPSWSTLVARASKIHFQTTLATGIRMDVTNRYFQEKVNTLKTKYIYGQFLETLQYMYGKYSM